MTREERIHEIVDLSKKRLSEYYRAGVPEIALKRVEREKNDFLEKTSDETIHKLMVFHEISEVAEKNNEFVIPAGTAMNSIFVFLLGYNQPNPMDAHYYCEECGYFEKASELFGMDLPEKNCPKCGFPLMRDGYSLPEEFAWGKKCEIDIELRIAGDFYDAAFKVIQNYYAQLNRMVITNWFGMKEHPGHPFHPNPHPGGAIILDPGKNYSDYDLGEYPNSGTAYDFGLERILLINTRPLNMLNECLEGKDMRISHIPCLMPTQAQLERLQENNLIDADEIAGYPKTGVLTYKEMIECCLAGCDTIQASDKTYTFSIHENYGILKKSGIFCREDVFEVMLQSGASREEAFRIADIIRKGRYSRDIGENEKLPEQIREIAPRIGYLFPRGHAAINRNMLLRLAYFL